MMNIDNKFTTPVGRLVQGAIYTPNTKNRAGKPLVYKDGSPRSEYWAHLAIPKGSEQHWNQTEWGAHLYNFVNTEFANKIPHNLAWKISDGDDRTPNEEGNVDADREGFAGHWIVKVKNGFAPALHDCGAPGFPILEHKDAIQIGDYVQMRIEMGINRGGEGKPSVYLNHTLIGFIKHGVAIRTFKPEDVAAVGFQQVAPSTPPAAMGNTVAATPAAAPTVVPTVPHTGVLMPPAPIVAPPTVRQMTAKAGANTYEQYKASGWTDEQLVQHGYMLP